MGDYKVSSSTSSLTKTKTTTLGSFSIDIIQLVLFSSVTMNVSFFDDNYNFFDSVNLNLTTNGNSAHVYDVTYDAAKTATSAASAASVASVNAASAASAALKTDAATDAATALTTASTALTTAATALTTASDALTTASEALTDASDDAALTAAAAADAASDAASDAAVNAGSVNTASIALNTASIALNTASIALNTASEYNYTKWGQYTTETEEAVVAEIEVTDKIKIATTDNSQTDGYIINFVTDYIEQVYLK